MSSSEDPHADDPLPPGWTRQFSKSNQKYFYFHKATAVTQWHFPTASEAKDPTVAKRRFEQAKERDKKRAANLPTATDDDGGSSSGVPADHNTANHKRPRHSSHTTVATVNKKAYSNNKNDFDSAFLELADKTSVAIIVPYRDLHVAQQRAAHLQQFVPHMIHFLNNCRADGLVSDYHIYIIEQSPSDGYKFNRGKLLNIGFDLARKSQRQHDVYIFHDVDLLPGDDLKPWYAKFPKTPIHIARVWDRYSGNPKYFGGVVSFSSSDYKRINGYPNNFFGWGGEDDEMQRRLERLGIQFEAPDKGTLRDLEAMNVTEKMDLLRQNKEWKCMVKWELKDEHEATWKTNGLVDLKYSVLNQTPLDETKKSTKMTVDVKLNGNHWTNAKAGVDYVETSWKK